ncbi:MAG: hypothetical protein AB7E85_06000 [Pseudobdellovibrionaceae bacterium]
MTKGHNRTGTRRGDGTSHYGHFETATSGRGNGRGRNRDRLREEGWREEAQADREGRVAQMAPKGFHFKEGFGNVDKKTTGITPESAIRQILEAGYDFIDAPSPSSTQRRAVQWARQKFQLNHDILVSNSAKSIILRRGDNAADEIHIIWSGSNLTRDAAKAIEDQVNGKRNKEFDEEAGPSESRGSGGFQRVGRSRYDDWSPA